MPKNRNRKLTRKQKADLQLTYTVKRADQVIKKQRKHLLIMAALLFVSIILNAVQAIMGVM